LLIQSLSAQWIERKNGLPESFKVISGSVIEPIDSLTAYVTIRDDKFYKTTDAGLNWNEVSSLSYPSHIRVQDMSAANEDSIWICGNSGDTTLIYATFNGGESWEQQYLNTGGRYLYFIEIFSRENAMAMGCAYSDVPLPVVQTTNVGEDWIEKNTEYLIHDYGEANCISMVNMETAFFQKKWSTLYKSTDGGTTWDSVYTPHSGESVNFYNEQFGLLGTTFGRIHSTVDGGTTWEEISNLGLNSVKCIEFLPGTPNRIWVSVAQNLFFSEDSGRTWFEYSIDGDFLSYDIDFVDDQHGWIMAENMVYYTETGDRIVSDLVNIINVPLDFKLSQNYPNPFNPTTQIEYSLPKSEHVKIFIYNTIGQKVRTLENGVVSAGLHEVIINAQDLASGIYYYRIEAGKFHDVKKMILLK
jgi:photosystem II stability/assembly factor-like uncharacterized protein